MDPISVIVGALVAGAAASGEDVAGQAVKDAYQGLRTILVDTYNFASASLLEQNPANPTFKVAAEQEIESKPAIVDDENVLRMVQALQSALVALPPEQLTAWGVDIENVEAGRDFLAEHITASAGGFRGRNLKAERDVRISNVTAGSSSENPKRK